MSAINRTATTQIFFLFHRWALIVLTVPNHFEIQCMIRILHMNFGFRNNDRWELKKCQDLRTVKTSQKDRHLYCVVVLQLRVRNICRGVHLNFSYKLRWTQLLLNNSQNCTLSIPVSLNSLELTFVFFVITLV